MRLRAGSQSDRRRTEPTTPARARGTSAGGPSPTYLSPPPAGHEVGGREPATTDPFPTAGGERAGRPAIHFETAPVTREVLAGLFPPTLEEEVSTYVFGHGRP